MLVREMGEWLKINNRKEKTGKKTGKFVSGDGKVAYIVVGDGRNY